MLKYEIVKCYCPKRAQTPWAVEILSATRRVRVFHEQCPHFKTRREAAAYIAYEWALQAVAQAREEAKR